MARLPLAPLINDPIVVTLKGLPTLIPFTLLYSVVWGLGFYFLDTTLGISEEALEHPGDHLSSALLFYGVFTLISVPYGCGLILIAHERLLGRRLGFPSLIGSSLARTPRAIFVTFCVFCFSMGIYAGVFVLFFFSYLIGKAIPGSTLIVLLIGGLFLALFALFFYVMWIAVPAACVIERRTITSFDRSSRLTKGNRGILAVAFVLVNLLSSTVYFSTAFLVFVLAMATEGIDSMAVSVLSVLVLALGLLVSCCLQFFLPVVAFVRLRELKEGGETEGLSSVFR